MTRHPFSSSQRVPPLVCRRLAIMLAAVELGDKRRSPAGEIDDKRADRHLASKFMPAKAATSQLEPESLLDFRLVGSQGSRAVGALPCPHPGPLPHAGEGDPERGTIITQL